MIHARIEKKNQIFDVKSPTDQFYAIKHDF
jgi:hypothetical protein